MIVAIKNVLENVIKESCNDGIKKIAKTVDEEKTAVSQLFIPVAAIITESNSRFSEENKGEYPFVLNGKRCLVCIRGERIIPIVIRITAKNEEEADCLLSRIIASIPDRYTQLLFGGEKNDVLDGSIAIIREEHSDGVQKMGGTYISAVLLECSLPVIAQITEVQAIREAVLE